MPIRCRRQTEHQRQRRHRQDSRPQFRGLQGTRRRRMDVHAGKRRRDRGVENQVRSDAVTPSPWMVSPWYDLLFIANLGWVGAFAFGLISADGIAPIQFWQMYFLTTPHRWLTLILVALDPDRREGRGLLIALLPALFLILLVAVELTAGLLLCLAMVDYVWNGWHFAAQHSGVLRIYGCKIGEAPAAFERYGL